MTQLWSVTCHRPMGSHGVTCYPTQVNTPRLHPSQTGTVYRLISNACGRYCMEDWEFVRFIRETESEALLSLVDSIYASARENG